MSEALVVHENDVEAETWSDPVRGEIGFRTLLGGALATPDFTAGVSEIEPGGWLGHHRHDPAEIYYVVTGEGVLVVDGQEHALRPGTAVHIPGRSEHGVRNTGSTPLRCFYAFAVGSFEDVDYEFSAALNQPREPE